MPPEKATNVTPFDPNAGQAGGQGFQKGQQGGGFQGKPKPPVDINDPTRSMPWDADAEKGVLSCFLHDPTNLLNDAQVNLADEAFYHPANQLLFKVMKEFNNGTRPVEYIALTNYLRDAGLLDKIGGAGMLSELLNFVPTPAHSGTSTSCAASSAPARRVCRTRTNSTKTCPPCSTAWRSA
jgi:replicative DNA helicase